MPQLVLGADLGHIGQHRDQLKVSLSRELITLLSDQMYQSPLKAIEELVVNSYDADAPQCHVVVPIASAGTNIGRLPAISVYDSGVGMDIEGLSDLWMIGSSTKRDQAIIALRKRQQIGKFGIGKLATYALANRITYLSSTGQGEILAVSLSFDEFKSDPAGPEEPVRLDVRVVTLKQALEIELVTQTLGACSLTAKDALNPAKSWTLVLLEELKPSAAELQVGRLRWVLRTAMPLSSSFKLHLNGAEVTSSKADYETVVRFPISDLSQTRIENLRRKTKQDWSIQTRPTPFRQEGDEVAKPALVCDVFDEGIFADVIVTKKTLYGGKSDDLTRSHGFFVRVRNRLINAEDPLFDLHPQAYHVFNRFRADVDANDLDSDLTAPREGVNISDRRSFMSDVLLEVFLEARSRYEKREAERKKREENKREEERNYVDPRNVERPVADALASENSDEGNEGDDADEEWFYLAVPDLDQLESVVARLYEEKTREPYSYEIENMGRAERLVLFLPGERKFILNGDHDMIIAFQDDTRALDLLYDVVTAEVMLEVYLREVGLDPHLVGEILERRDTLLRSLAREQVTSIHAIAANLRNAVSSERDLEIALVVAARALGFVAKHMSGATNPDGLARLRDYPVGERKITLEAKSSAGVPSLGVIDFAGLAQHVVDTEAQGCLLVAPDYPGSSRGSDAAAAKRANDSRVSCWTVDQLARVVEAMESRYITARHVLDIVLSAYAPDDVTLRVEKLLREPSHPPGELVKSIVAALRSLETYGPDDLVRSIDMLMVELRRAGVVVPSEQVKRAMSSIAGASYGALAVTSDGRRFRLDTSVEELERRVEGMTRASASPRRASTFRSVIYKPDIT